MRELLNARVSSFVVGVFSTVGTVFGCGLSFFAGVIVVGKLLLAEQRRCDEAWNAFEIERKRREEWQVRFWRMEELARSAIEESKKSLDVAHEKDTDV